MLISYVLDEPRKFDNEFEYAYIRRLNITDYSIESVSDMYIIKKWWTVSHITWNSFQPEISIFHKHSSKQNKTIHCTTIKLRINNC